MVAPRGQSNTVATNATGMAKGVTAYNGLIGEVIFNAANIPVGTITYSQIQNESAHTILGNPTAGSVSPSEIMLGAALGFSGTTLQTVAMTGDITTPANSFVTTIANSAVTYAKIQNESNATLLGNNSGGAAAPSEITLGTNIYFVGAKINSLDTNYYTFFGAV